MRIPLSAKPLLGKAIGMGSALDFSNYREYLLAVSRQLSNKRGGHSVSQWARSLGYRSPQTLGMVLTGRRLPSPELLSRIVRQQKLSPTESQYLQTLVSLEKAHRRGADVSGHLEELRRFRKLETPLYLEAEAFSYVADWYHLVIRQLVGVPGFREDSAWIRQRLRGKVTTVQIRKALATMLRLGVLTRDASGRLTRTKSQLTTVSDVPMQASREHHRQMLGHAASALEHPVEEREFGAMTFQMRRQDLPKAKQLIRSFREQISRDCESAKGESVFQFGVFLFSHTQGSGERS
ncbi:DUF4423 domain-containing protein [bacterium]|nr:DUF4423 domain-containing protein [bacterium]